MEYIRCQSCGKTIASYDIDKSVTKFLTVQCKSCKAYNVINENKVKEIYVKIGNKRGE